MDAGIKRHEEEIRQIRRSFFDGSLNGELASKHSELLKEWSRSAALVSPNKKSEERDLRVFDRVTEAQREHLAYLADYYRSRHEVLEQLGCAIFYLDDQCATYAKHGDQKLLDSLKSQGIRVGTVFSENNLGYTSVTRAMEVPLHTVERVGSENYLSLFCSYALFARFAEGSPFGFAGTNLIIVPLSIYSEQLRIIIHHLLKEEDAAYKDKYFYPLIRERNALIEKSATLSRDLFLLVDSEGEVVYTSPSFSESFGRGVSEYDAHIPLKQFAPELSFVLSQSPHPIVARSTKLACPQGEERFFVDCASIEEQGKEIGKKVVLRTLAQINQYTSPLRGSAVVYSFDSIIGSSKSVMECKGIALRASRSKSNVLITGESGTGKELFAQAIHHASDRSTKPFVAVNCGAIPKELVGSELFGYEEGAFTGAKKGGHIGKIEQAQGGTLFLDEIGEMPLDVQVFLLRFLDSGEITRLGGKKSVAVDVRVISATNRNLYECVQSGAFRLDLYYRLNVLHLSLPPLRQRQEDFEDLIEHFLRDLSPRLGKSATHVAPDALALFIGRDWPGNLRELRNVIERCVNLMPDGVEVMDAACLPEGAFSDSRSPIAVDNQKATDGTDIFFSGYRSYERAEIQKLLVECRGNKKRVAECMGISRATLYSKMKKYGIPL